MAWAFVVVAVCTAFFFCVSHHLGLIEKAYEVCGTIASCPMCSVFWGTFVVLLLCGCYVLPALLLSVALAYASIWVSLIFDVLRRKYDAIWKRRKKH